MGISVLSGLFPQTCDCLCFIGVRRIAFWVFFIVLVRLRSLSDRRGILSRLLEVSAVDLDVL